MSLEKPKTLILRKPLSLAKQAQISTALGKALSTASKPLSQVKPAQKKPTQSQKTPPNEKPAKSARPNKKELGEIHKQRQARYHHALSWVCQAYPACFNSEAPRPLKIGIINDLLQAMKAHPVPDQPSYVSVRHALGYYTHRRRYHQAVLEGTYRYDLTGQPGAEITPQERNHAQAQCAAKEILKQKRPDSKIKKTISEAEDSKTLPDQLTNVPIEEST